MDGFEHKKPLAEDVRGDLDSAPDDELRRLIKEAGDILSARETARKREAIAKIKALAKEHGLSLSIDRPARKRGRPRKKE